MGIQEYSQGMKERISSWRLGRKLLWLMGIAFGIFLIYALIILYYPYSRDGSRSGIVRKLSNKGYVFKTWEGELQMSLPLNGAQVPAGGEVWYFSVRRGDDHIIEELRRAESGGARVTLYYTQYLRQFDWRGETEYFIDSVKMVQ